MASTDWVPDDSDQAWLPAVDVRKVVGALPPGPVNLEDPAWDVLPAVYSLRDIRAAVHRLGDPDLAVVEKSLAELWWMLCGEGTTDAAGALFVPSLINAPGHVGPHLRAMMLQLVGDMSRVEPTMHRSRMLRTMQTIGIYDQTGSLENWSVEAVRAMAGRDGDLLAALMQDDSPEVRGRAAYVLAAAEPVSFDVPGFMHARLAVESDPAVQTILILCIAQYEKDQDRTADALAWARSLWSDPAAALSIRLGGIIAWLCLTPADPPPELRALRAQMPMSVIGGLLRELPWIWSLGNHEDQIADWWRRLDPACSPADV